MMEYGRLLRSMFNDTPTAGEGWANRWAIVFLVSFFVYMVLGLLLSYQSLDYDWNYDDIHLIQRYSGSQLLSVFSGHWDLDQMETAGFRPLTAIFNHTRAVLFGESVASHRIFLVFLFSIYLILLGCLTSRFGISWYVSILAGILILCARYSMYHFVWISDGVHILQGLFFVVSALLLLLYIDYRKYFFLAASLVFAALCLLTREDSLSVYPVLVLLGTAYAIYTKRFFEFYKSIALYTVILLIIFVIFWWWRAMVLPEAEGFIIGFDSLLKVWGMFYSTVSLAGKSGTIPELFLAFFVVLLIISIFVLKMNDRYKFLMWLLFVLFACLPGIINDRPNLLFFAISFYCIFVASILVEFAKISRYAFICCAFVFLMVAGFSAKMSLIHQESMHPMSFGQIRRDWLAIYGSESDITIPPERKKRFVAKLAKHGLGPELGEPNFDKWYERLLMQGRIGLSKDDEMFAPSIAFSEP